MRRNAGLTLIEVVIGSVILSAVMIMAMTILLSGSRQVERASISQDLEQHGRQIISTLGGDFVTARFKLDYSTVISPPPPPVGTNMNLQAGKGVPLIFPGVTTSDLGIYANNTEIRYMIGGVTDEFGMNAKSPPTSVPPPYLQTGQMVWGANTPFHGGPDPFRKDLAYFVRFEAHTVLYESSGSPPVTTLPYDWTSPNPFPYPPQLPPLNPTLKFITANLDIDKNGSLLDTFVVGKLRRYVVAPVGHPALPPGNAGGVLTSENLDDNVILKLGSGGAWNADMEQGVLGSGLMFQFIDQTGAALPLPPLGTTPPPTATAVQIIIWHGAFDDRHKDFWLRKSKTTVHFRNSQT